MQVAEELARDQENKKQNQDLRLRHLFLSLFLFLVTNIFILQCENICSCPNYEVLK